MSREHVTDFKCYVSSAVCIHLHGIHTTQHMNKVSKSQKMITTRVICSAFIRRSITKSYCIKWGSPYVVTS